MNELMIFNNPEFGDIRTIEEDSKVLFCGSDVAKALGYKRPNDAISAHCRGTVKRRTGVQTGTKADGSPAIQNIEMLFIPEGDIYRLAAKSELPGAERFESWIFDEVLPSIRKHGAYMTDDTLDKMIHSPEFGIKLLTALKEEKDKRKALEAANTALTVENNDLIAENERQRQVIADFEPIKRYMDTILESPGVMATSQIAADYDMSGRRLNKILHEEGVQRCVNGQWLLYRKHMGQGYTKSKTFTFDRSDGIQDSRTQTYWTQKGRIMIHEILTKRGITAVMDRGQA